MSQHTVDVSTERAALMRSQRRKIDLQTARLRAELVPKAEISEIWARVIGNARARLLAIGQKISGRLVMQPSPAVICGIVDGEVHDALNELASEGNLDRLLSELGADAARAGDGDVEGAEKPDDQPVGGRKSKVKPGGIRRGRKVGDSES